MSDRLSKQVTVEREHLNRLIETHRPLLEKCAGEAPSDIELSALAALLHSYLKFRHVFRQAYAFQLQWEKMASLTLDCESTLRVLEKDLDAFLRSAE